MNVLLRTLAMALLVLTLVVVPTMAQEEPPETASESDPIALEDMGIGGGGPLGGWMALDVAELNAALEDAGYAPLPEGMLFMGGGGGGGLLQGFRFGGYGAGGDVRSAAGEKSATLSIGYGGFWLSYGLVSAARYDLSAGLMIGGGGATLKLTDRQPASFEDALGQPANTVLDRGFFALRPDANVGLQILPWMSLNVSGGYLLTFGDDWSHQGTALPGPPASFNAWTIQVMLQFGGRG